MGQKTFVELLDSIGEYTNVKNKIELTWGTREGRAYLDDLCLDTRCEAIPRQGFKFDALLAIEDMLELHDKTFPQFKLSGDLWNNV
jgi:hypothetical protein